MGRWPRLPRLGRATPRRLAAIITAGLTLLLVPSCVITARLHVVATPSAGESTLTGLAAVSPTDVWATGESFFQTYRGAVEQPLILHWDGRSWRIAATPDFAYAGLADVVALAANDVWAVGFRAGGPFTVAPLLLHFNGQGWTEVAAPSLPNWAALWGISAVSAHDIWAVGGIGITVGAAPGSGASIPLTLHFDGATWRRVPFPSVAGSSSWLDSVAVAGPNAVYAVGGSQGYAKLASSRVVARWDGHAWTLLPLTGIQSDAELNDVAVAGSDVWVVGDRATAAGPIEGLAWRSHAGGGWTAYRPDPHPRGVLNGVHATSTREVWAAGTPGNDGTSDGVLLVRWDGLRWKVAFRIPAVPELRGLAHVTTAGGRVFSVGGTTKTLAVQN